MTNDLSRYDKKLEHILRTSARIFAEKSYHSTSMRDIARETEVSLSGLYHYCKSKEELLYLIQDHCFGRVSERLEERIKTVSDPFEKLRILIDNHLSFFAANMAEMKVLSHEAESLAGDLHKHVTTKKERYARLARKILKEIQEQAETRTGGPQAGSPLGVGRSGRVQSPRTNINSRVDLTVSTYALFGMMNWIYNWYDPTGKLSVHQLVDNITRLFLNGFLSSSTERLGMPAPRTEKISVWRTA
ncbi:MAG TPA: TetR/AcrR family transcriptional regulator [Pyrinomonadaceae bacterium]|nr:TetR/AcrR family transcriptional regulator [Pyrinomonadaceae bacterium]